MDADGDGDTLGDADELGHGEEVAEHRAPLLTPEGRAIAGAGLVLMSVFTSSIFQFIGFLVLRSDNGGSPAAQFALIAGPSAVLAVAGAALAWSTRSRTLTPGLRGLAGATVVVGLTTAAVVVIGIIAGYAFGPDFFAPF
jgi:hypothetical protein